MTTCPCHHTFECTRSSTISFAPASKVRGLTAGTLGSAPALSAAAAFTLLPPLLRLGAAPGTALPPSAAARCVAGNGAPTPTVATAAATAAALRKVSAPLELVEPYIAPHAPQRPSAPGSATVPQLGQGVAPAGRRPSASVM